MKFLNRQKELARLRRLKESEFAVIWGRRRIGKTRLILEWLKDTKGVYWVADESAAHVQRKYFALALEERLPGFAQIEYPDWTVFFSRLIKEAREQHWKGPVVLDELPYVIETAPEFASVLQRFVDHEAKQAGLIFVVCGSSQRMMQEAVLEASAPLYGRATEIIKLSPLAPTYIGKGLNLKSPTDQIRAYGLWGGIPRYWELAARYSNPIEEAVENLVLDSSGTLFDEPNRLLLDETPSAISLRPVLDVIGMGAHRLSEIASRLNQPATSLSRPLERLRELEYVERQVPFGAHESGGKKALYQISDPFLRFWFATVASRKSILTHASDSWKRQWLSQVLPHHWAGVWEDVCRRCIPFLSIPSLERRGELIPFGPAQRFWHGEGPEWDVVSQSLDGSTVLLGEVKWTKSPSDQFITSTLHELMGKGTPPISSLNGKMIVYAVFVSEQSPGFDEIKQKLPPNVLLLSAADILALG